MIRRKSIIIVTLFCLGVGPFGCALVPPTPLPGAELPQWQGLVIGQSTIADVENLLGKPDEVIKGRLRGIEILVFSAPPPDVFIHIGVLRADGVVVYVYAPLYSEEYPLTGTYPPTLEWFIQRYGEPERVTWGDSLYTRTYIWASRGVVVEGRVPAWSGGDWGTGITWVEYFVPTDVDSYLHTWGKDIPFRRGYGEEDAYHNPELPWPFPGTPPPSSIWR
jgi:hypothetical protein